MADETLIEEHATPEGAFMAALEADPAQVAFAVVSLNVTIGMLAARVASLEHEVNECMSGRGGRPEPMPRETMQERAHAVAARFVEEGRTVAEGNLRAGGILTPVEDAPSDPSGDSSD